MDRQGNKGQARASEGLTSKLHHWMTSLFEHSECRREQQSTTSARLLRWGKGALLGCVAFAFCRVPLIFSVNPLGIALLCSAQTDIGWIVLGLALGWLGAKDAAWITGDARLYAAGVLLALVLRLTVSFVCVHRIARQKESLRSLGASYVKRGWERVRYIVSVGAHDDVAEDTVALPPLFGEPLRYRVMVALLAAIVPSVGGSVIGGYAYYDLYGALTYLLLTPALVPLFSGVWENVQSGAKAQARCLAGLVAIFFFACYCCRSVSVIGVSLVLTTTIVLALWLTERCGVLAGGIVAVVGGLSLDVRCVPMLVALVVMAVLARPLLGNVASGVAVAVSLLCAMLTGGVTFLLETISSALVGGLLFAVAGRVQNAYQSAKDKPSRSQPSSRPPASSLVDESEYQLICEQRRNDALCARISATAGAFGSLAEIFHSLEQTRHQPDAVEIRRMMDDIFDEHCPRCIYRSLCWTDEYSATAAGVRAMSRQLAAKTGASVVGCLPEPLRRRCPCLIGMMEELDLRMKRKALEWQNGVDGEQFARSYDSISHLLRDLLHEDNGVSQEEFHLQTEVSRAVAERLAQEGITPRQVCVLGERRVRVRMVGISPAALTLTREQLQQMLGEVCGVTFDRARYDGSGEGCLSLIALPTLRADYAHLCSVADESAEEGGKVGGRVPCGDSLRVFEREDGMLYVLLCDGMGSGRSAALTSGPATVFLERVLLSGVSVETALRMLNHYLRARAPTEECSSTVDLLAVDLYTGKARFIKSGAAPSMVVRDGRAIRITSHTVPLGILQAVDAQVIPFELKENDLVVLMSDGVSDAADGESAEEDWLDELLVASGAEGAPETLVSALITAARSHGSRDDATAICVRIGRTASAEAQAEQSA